MLSALGHCFGWSGNPADKVQAEPAACDRNSKQQPPGKANADLKFPEERDGRSADKDNELDYDAEKEERQLWDVFAAIPDEAFATLAQQHLEKREDSETTFHVENRLNGSYNYVVVLGNGTTKLVIKIPANGSKDRWSPEHAFLMRSEAHTLLYLKHKVPHFPCPEVLAKDETFDNTIGAPYLMQSFLEGQQASNVWFEGLADEDGDIDVYEANDPSEELEKKRTAFLSSLATTMAELRNLDFDAIGMLYLQDESNPDSFYIGTHHDFMEMCALVRTYHSRPVFKSSTEYYHWRHVKCCGLDTEGQDFMRATILASAPFKASKKHHGDDRETFTLGLDDLNLQNILVNSAGEVTGILDWDQVTVVPRCVGFSTVPVFLQEDFEMGYSLPEHSAMFPWNLIKYRKMYAAAMKRACADDEEVARYCEKSALYMAVHKMMYGDHGSWSERETALMKKLLLEIPYLRGADLERLREALCEDEFGGHWRVAKDIWRKWIPEILDPNVY